MFGAGAHSMLEAGTLRKNMSSIPKSLICGGRCVDCYKDFEEQCADGIRRAAGSGTRQQNKSSIQNPRTEHGFRQQHAAQNAVEACICVGLSCRRDCLGVRHCCCHRCCHPRHPPPPTFTSRIRIRDCSKPDLADHHPSVAAQIEFVRQIHLRMRLKQFNEHQAEEVSRQNIL